MLFSRIRSKWKLKFSWKRFALILSISALSLLVSVIAIDRWVVLQAKESIFTEYEQIPQHEVAVVLGTSKYIGKILNTYYTHRINAAIELYNQGKVKQFLLSGDNAHRSYNEPWTMKRDLLKAGVPEEVIHLDYAGFRTLDSIVRAKKIFASERFLIVTQRFHCERALFIADAYSIDAQCLAVAGPTANKQKTSMRVRELLARVKAFLDLYIINTQPKFLGPQEPIVAVKEPNKAANEPLQVPAE
ncbi:TPA: SanA/YdcF family protein [Vibrio alginolyticus]|uniref:SanA/YdcF family protein n=1 Tax=Vibrio alginolyticus TaxID=663 RepID=UPI001427F8B1|nr:ElyC/SanA/YdcF family protein [Vibrio alginolyticus]QIR88287.1 SanA protein [Vibrio diabolicus]EHC9867288.1 SanA protein [Vibrio alginolyticus]EJS0322700.1 YdcF family protein [Vibrio alginolyticus]ELB2904708.1 YdcF family protein [Vibrio alginolyticus]ELW1398823.1 YdcF family protein [Vibrio alginolyticus]